MNDNSNFRMSRIYAQGWNAGSRLTDDLSAPDTNPYRGGSERARWAEGFTAARSTTNILPFRTSKRISQTTRP
jgi:hypothetical protein